MSRVQQISSLKKKLQENPKSPNALIWKNQLKSLENTQPLKRASKPNPQGINDIVSPKLKENMERLDSIDESDSIRRKYLKTVLYPETHTDKPPDELSLPTCIYRSVREFNLLVNMDGTANAGRFSFAALPVLGNRNDPEQFQVGIVDVTQPWPTDFEVPNIYVDDNLGDDPRVDPYLEELTSSIEGYYYQNTVLTQTLLTGNIFEGSLFQPTNVPANTLNVTNKALLGGVSFSFGSFSGTVNNAIAFSMPAGTYNFIPEMLGNWTSGVGNQTHIICLAINENNQAIGAFHVGYAISFATYGSMNAIRYFADFEGINIVSERILMALSVNFNAESEIRYVFGVGAITGNISGTVTSGFQLVPVIDKGLTEVSDSGVIIKMRPIAQSALVTCTLPDINAGGNIVAYSAPSGDIKNYYYNTSNIVGPYQNWEVLARNNKGICTLDGNFKTGSYTFSQPWDKNDLLMRTPSECNKYSYQGIIVSGQINPSVALTGIINVGRIRIVTIFEYTTDSRLFEPQAWLGSGDDLDFVLAYLSTCDHSMENPLHLQKLGEYVKKGASFFKANVPTLIKGLTLAASLL